MMKCVSRALLVLMMVVMVCGSVPALAEQPETRTVETVKGPVEVPANPQRIVAAYIVGDILALGGTLAAVDEPFKGCAFERMVQDVPRIEKWEPEHIMAADPDLIFVISDIDYDKLKDIAPTVLVPFGEMSTVERLMFVGTVMGKEAEAQALIDQYDARIAEVKAKLEASPAKLYDQTVALMEMWEPGKIMVLGDRWGRGGDVIYSRFGLKAPAKTKADILGNPDSPYVLISEEVLPEFAGDIIFATAGDDGTTGFEGGSIWESLNAVKAGRVIKLDFNAFYYDDILSSNMQLDIIVDGLLAIQ